MHEGTPGCECEWRQAWVEGEGGLRGQGDLKPSKSTEWELLNWIYACIYALLGDPTSQNRNDQHFCQFLCTCIHIIRTKFGCNLMEKIANHSPRHNSFCFWDSIPLISPWFPDWFAFWLKIWNSEICLHPLYNLKSSQFGNGESKRITAGSKLLLGV